MAVPSVPDVGLESRDQGEVFLRWADVAGETSYRVEQSGPGSRSTRLFRNFIGGEEARPWFRSIGRDASAIRKELAAGDGRLFTLKEILAAGAVTAEYSALTENSEYCFRVRSVNAEGEGPSEIDCITVWDGCSTPPGPSSATAFPRYNASSPESSFNQLSQAVQGTINTKIIASAPCIVCAVDGVIDLDLSKCANFLVIVDQDICSIRIHNSRPGRAGCFIFAFFPCADDLQRRLGGFPVSFGFTGGECSAPFTSGCSVEVCWRDYGDGPRAEGVPTLGQTLVGMPGAPMRIACLLNNPNCELDCGGVGDHTVRLTVVGGKRPYTWVTTYGNIAPLTASHDEVAILSLPTNLIHGNEFAYGLGKIVNVIDDATSPQGAATLGGNVYDCDDNQWTTMSFNTLIGGGITYRYKGDLISGLGFCTALPVVEGDGPLPTSDGSPTHVICAGVKGIVDTFADFITELVKWGKAITQANGYEIVDLRDTGSLSPSEQPQCLPCGLVDGAVVTVTDADGRSVSKIITVKI